jgi:hypothetical protein
MKLSIILMEDHLNNLVMLIQLVIVILGASVSAVDISSETAKNNKYKDFTFSSNADDYFVDAPTAILNSCEAVNIRVAHSGENSIGIIHSPNYNSQKHSPLPMNNWLRCKWTITSPPDSKNQQQLDSYRFRIK